MSTSAHFFVAVAQYFFKGFIEFVRILCLFYVLVLWPGVMWDLSFPTRDRTFPALEGEVLTIAPPGKSLPNSFTAINL